MKILLCVSAVGVCLLFPSGESTCSPRQRQPVGHERLSGWKTRSLEYVTLFHNLSEEQQPSRVLALAARVRTEMADELGITATEPLTVFLCKDVTSFATTAGRPPSRGQVGIAMLEQRRIVLLAFRAGKPVPLAETTVHEVAHVVLADAGGKRLPIWFQEGFALYQSHQVSFLEAAHLSLAALFRGLLPLRDIEKGFPYGKRLSSLAYAQSLDAFSYLSSSVGLGGVGEMLRGARQHGSFSLAFRKVYGAGMTTFEQEWRESLTKRYRWPLLLAGWAPLAAVLLVLTLVVGLIKRATTRRTVARWDAEEHGSWGTGEPPGLTIDD